MTLREEYDAAVQHGKDVAAQQRRGPIPATAGESTAAGGGDLGVAPLPVPFRDWRKQQKGFAVINPQTQRQIASQGGRMVHARGTGRQWTREDARQASLKGHAAKRARRAAAAAQIQVQRDRP